MLQENLKKFNIPVVRAFDPQTDMNAFIDYVRGLDDLEGFVVRFDDGHMVKLKCDWYVAIHKIKESILFDRSIVELILDNKLDDIKPHLIDTDKIRINEFEHDIVDRINDLCIDFVKLTNQYNKSSRKDFALNVAPNINHLTKSVIFSLWDNPTMFECRKVVNNVIIKHLSKNSSYRELANGWFSGIKFNN